MSRRSSIGYSDWERWQRQRAQEAARQQRAAAAAAKVQREQDIADRKRNAEWRTGQVEALVRQFQTAVEKL